MIAASDRRGGIWVAQHPKGSVQPPGGTHPDPAAACAAIAPFAPVPPGTPVAVISVLIDPMPRAVPRTVTSYDTEAPGVGAVEVTR